MYLSLLHAYALADADSIGVEFGVKLLDVARGGAILRGYASYKVAINNRMPYLIAIALFGHNSSGSALLLREITLNSNLLTYRDSVDIDVWVKLLYTACCSTILCCDATYYITILDSVPLLSLAILSRWCWYLSCGY